MESPQRHGGEAYAVLKTTKTMDNLRQTYHDVGEQARPQGMR